VLRYYPRHPALRSMIGTARTRCASGVGVRGASRASSSAWFEKAGYVDRRPRVPPAFAEAMDDDLGVRRRWRLVHTAVRQAFGPSADDKETAVARLSRGRAHAGCAGPRPARRALVRAGTASAARICTGSWTPSYDSCWSSGRRRGRARTTRRPTPSATSCSSRGWTSRTPRTVRGGPRLALRDPCIHTYLFLSSAEQ